MSGKPPSQAEPSQAEPSQAEPSQAEPPEFDISHAHSARVYNYWLGGKDNYAA
ncbi:MAG TPA: hypothetical protein DEH11_19995, partial [Actinobacteria bacterium]|nr:hypothetical protein [Actinomycetota bacterium]